MFIEVIVNKERLNTEEKESIERLLSSETTCRSEEGSKMTVSEILRREGWPSPTVLPRDSRGVDDLKLFENVKSFLTACLYADEDFSILEAEGLSQDEESDLEQLLASLSEEQKCIHDILRTENHCWSVHK